jgi:hypothetical protein
MDKRNLDDRYSTGKNNSRRFPIEAAISRDIFSVSASSGSVKRVFSTATDILHAKRSRTKADIFQMVICSLKEMHALIEKCIDSISKIN